MRRVLLSSVLLLFSIILNAQGWGQIQKIVPADREQADYFGYAVTMSGDYAVIGAHWDDVTTSNMGSAYVYKKDVNGNWIEHQNLTAPDKRQNDQFGYSVAIHGNYLIVGAIGQSYNAANSSYIQAAGAAYIYEKDTNNNWNFVQKIVASDREYINQFGYAVDLNGNYAIVSPVRHDYDASGNNFQDDAGAVYVFERDGSGTWSEVQKIVASDRTAFDYFGQTGLAVDGNYIVVGSVGDDEDDNGSNFLSSAGSAYIFERDGSGIWNEIQKIVNSDREAGDTFGRTVTIDGNYLVVGADYEDEKGNAAGAAYVFEKQTNGTWNHSQKLTATNGAADDHFGRDVDMDDNYIIIGSHLNDIGSPGDNGAAYIFENQDGVWNETAFIYDAFNQTSEYFGYTVAISGDFAIVGAYEDGYDENEENELVGAGAAFIFDANEPYTLSVIENDLENTIKAYPNPVINSLTIDLGSFHETTQIKIHNVLGQNILSKNYTNSRIIELEFNLSKGIYLVEVKVNNENTSVLKIVKH
ncbi:T9SS type A sorting domain-containing protein [Psychroserpens sp. AS72]|uniref:T9SS type A sorting domain-containing protein n=1 Tax=Psychroserpens sp. AS72 TaxID=3135775 RepID=UPI00317AC3B4